MIIVMIDDTFGHNNSLALAHQLQRIIVKCLLHRKCIGKIQSFIILSYWLQQKCFIHVQRLRVSWQNKNFSSTIYICNGGYNGKLNMNVA